MNYQLIPIKELYPHPSNPRKNLGDLEELTASIKANGVMQNLTAVKRSEGGYTVIIGHRRLAAAIKAELTELPCYIAEMDEKEQARTMLMENMQRKDLSVYEQAQGFQMMLDLGETMKSISKTTGFTQKTIKARLNLLELDKEKFAETEARNISIDEYIRLEQVKSIEKRNELLNVIGTEDYNFKLKQAVQEEKDAAERIEMLKLVQTFAKKYEGTAASPVDYRWYCGWYHLNDAKVPEDAKTASYLYTESKWSITLYKENPKEESKPAEETEEQKARRLFREYWDNKEKEHRLLIYQFNELHNEFLTSFNEYGKFNRQIVAWVTSYLEDNTIGDIMPLGEKDISVFAQIMDVNAMMDGNDYRDVYKISDWPDLAKAKTKEPIRFLMAMIQADEGQDLCERISWEWKNGCNIFVYKENPVKDGYIKLLGDLGYRPGKEERDYILGTHEIFNIKEEYK